MISGVNNNQGAAQTYVNSRTTENSKIKDKQETKAGEASVILELGTTKDNSSGTYSKPVATSVPEEASTIDNTGNKKQISEINAKEINRLWKEANRATQNLRNMVEELLKSQGLTFKDALSGEEELVVDEETRAAAAAAISEDGEFGVKAVSDRIVEFAKAVSNDNPEMYDELMSAIDEGFDQAEKAFGGELPEISKKTREEINKKMEQWKNEKSSTAEVSKTEE